MGATGAGPVRTEGAADRRRLLDNVVALTAFQVAGYLFPLLTLPYLARVLGAERFGLLIFAQAFAAYFRAIVEYGFKLTATRDVAASRGDAQRLAQVFWGVMATKLLLAGGCLLLLLGLTQIVPQLQGAPLLYLLSFGTVLGDLLIPIWFFQGVERMRYITALNVVARGLFTVAVFVFVRGPEDYLLVPLLDLVGFLVAGALSLALVFRRFRVPFVRVRGADVRHHLRSGFSVFVTDFVPNLYNNSTIFLLGLFWPLTDVGHYGTAVKIVDVANSPSYVVARAYYPLLNRDFRAFGSFRNWALGVGLLLSIVVALAVGPILALLDPVEYGPARPLVWILAPGPILISVMLTYGTNCLLVHRLDRLQMVITVAVSCVGFLLALALVPPVGAVGASVTLTISRAALAGLLFWAARRVLLPRRVM